MKDGFKAPISTNSLSGPGTMNEMASCALSSPSIQAMQDWDLNLKLETANPIFKPLLDKFNRDTKASLSHLLTVHNETCGCQTDCGASELNRVWNQKKVAFMEMHKLSGLPFEDFLNRILHLLLSNPIQNVQPLSESDFWLHLRQPYPPPPPPPQGLPENTVTSPHSIVKSNTIDDEELADIQSFIMNDIVEESSKASNSSAVEPGVQAIMSPADSDGSASGSIKSSSDCKCKL